MDFPLFFLDHAGNRILIAVIAIIHVVINHPFAVGGYPLVTLLEYIGWKKKDQRFDDLAYKITFVFFIVTTTLGALTGVGIWLATSLIAPFGIGSLLRVFFWAWFFEWTIFVSEVILIMLYFLLWKKWTTGRKKIYHILLGVALSAFSWITMSVIVAILGFMMDTGSWVEKRTLLSGIFNPLYLPQLAFRTPYAMATAGLVVWFLIFFFVKKSDTDFRNKAIRIVSLWTVAWLPVVIQGGLWYWQSVPKAMGDNLNVALVMLKYVTWSHQFLIIMGLAVGVIFLFVAIGATRPYLIPRFTLVIPVVLAVWLLGHFERVREFIRKPYIIADYMYSNGVRKDELPIFQRDGILPYATYTSVKRATDENLLVAGRDVFMLACSRCHTTSGMNGVVQKFTNLYQANKWDKDAIQAFILSMHNTRTFMPPFPGNLKEAEALATYILYLQKTKESLPGAQSVGIPRPLTTGSVAQ